MQLNVVNLLLAQGFGITGVAESQSGWSVSGGCDVNGDGYDDVMVMSSGISCVIYGNITNYLTNINLENLMPSQGFSVTGLSISSLIGPSNSGISCAGTVNNDRYNDIIIGYPAYSVSTLCKASPCFYGISYVIYGGSNPVNIVLDTSDLPTSISSSQGFYIEGYFTPNTGWLSGYSVSGAGDFNGDGYNDVIVGSADTYIDTGSSQVIYGGNGAIANVQINDAFNGVYFDVTGVGGIDSGVFMGVAVSSAGDFNGDGADDVIITSEVGVTYLIFGGSGVSSINALGYMTSTQGFSITGPSCSIPVPAVNDAGDVNGDGVDDVIIGAPCANSNAGISYVIYGNKTIVNWAGITLPPTINQGFCIFGSANSFSGYSVSSAGDMNKDVYDDIIIGALFCSLPSSCNGAGEAYVIYGGDHLLSISNITLSNLNSNQGFSIIGTSGSGLGASVSDAGDINGDGYDDVIIGAPFANSNAGISYVIYGAESGFITSSPTSSPTSPPSGQPSSQPTNQPSSQPSNKPSSQPSNNPTSQPTSIPSMPPTEPRVLVINEDVNTLSSVVSSFASFLGAIALYYGPSIVLNNWGYKYKVIYSDLDKAKLKGNEIGLFLDNGQLVALHQKHIYKIEINNGNNHGISEGLHTIITDKLNKKPPHYKYIYNEIERQSLEGNQIGLQYHKAKYLPNFCHIGELSVYKKHTHTELIEKYTIQIGNEQNSGISKGLFDSIVKEYNVLSKHLLLVPEENQLRDFLLTKERIYPNTYIPIYTDLGYLQGFIYTCCLMLKKYQRIQSNRISDESLSVIDSIVQLNMELLVRQESKEYRERQISMKDLFQFRTDIQDDSARSSNPLLYLASNNDICISMQGAGDTTRDQHQNFGIDSTLLATNSNILPSPHDIESTTRVAQNPGLLCIDVSMDPEYIKMQDKTFTEFGEHLMLAYKDLSYLFNGEKDVMRLLDASSQDPNAVAIYHCSTSNNPESSASNNLMLSLFGVRQFIEFLPLIKHGTQGAINLLGYNATIPEILDNKAFLFAIHLVTGHAGAMLLPQDAMNDGVFVATTGSMSYGARLLASHYLIEQRQEILSRDKAIDTFEITKYCTSTILAHTAPSLATCAISNLVQPGTPCAVTGYDMIISASLGGSECYSVYKAKTQDDHKNTADTVVPCIVDAVAMAAASQYFGFDSSSLATMMLSVKQNLALVSSVVATDYISRVAIDIVPDEFKEAYIDPIVEGIREVYTCGVDYIYGMIETGEDFFN